MKHAKEQKANLEPNQPNAKLVKEKEQSIFVKDPCRFRWDALLVGEREPLILIHVRLVKDKVSPIEPNKRLLRFQLEFLLVRI